MTQKMREGMTNPHLFYCLFVRIGYCKKAPACAEEHVIVEYQAYFEYNLSDILLISLHG